MAIVVEQAASLPARPIIADGRAVVVHDPSLVAAVPLPVVVPTPVSGGVLVW